jgi:hypothetical protein
VNDIIDNYDETDNNFFGNVAAGKIAQEIALQKCGRRVNSDGGS